MHKKKALWSILLAISLLTLCMPTEAAGAKTTAKAPVSQQALAQRAGNPKVIQLQQLLADTGFYPGSMTGILDRSTKEAISRAQAKFKLKQTGDYDQKLANILTHEAKSKPKRYRKKILMQATAYTSKDPGCGNLTKREHHLRKGLVAVDPKFIALGTRLYIEGYGYAVADDIGSAIKGTRIDLAFENRKDAIKFGRKTVTVLLLN